MGSKRKNCTVQQFVKLENTPAGDFNPSEKDARQIGNLPQLFGVKNEKIGETTT